MEVLDALNDSYGLTGRMRKIAPRSKRMTHFIIDSLAGMVLTYFLLLLLVQTKLVADVFESRLLLPFVYVFTRSLYGILAEASKGKTLGKALSTSKVVGANGSSPPSLWQACGRQLIRFIPFYPIFFALGMRWHDEWTNTQVICE